MRPTFLFSLVLSLAALSALTMAQNRLPQEYISPDEIITLNPDMTFEQAFQILSQIAYEKEGKTIIDPLKHDGRIEVDIENLPWKKAFEVVLKAHRLGYVEHEQFYEVTGLPEIQMIDKERVPFDAREIRIEAVFFEADRRAIAKSGIDWTIFAGGSDVQGSFSVNGASEFMEEIVEGTVSGSTEVDGTDISVTALLKAFESRNLGRILAQPEVVVLTGQEGRIQIGQDFSIKTRDFAGNIIDRFFSTGTILTVKPLIHEENGVYYIHLSIHAERSNVVPDPISTIINKSQADTHVLLLDGESTLLGGLYTREYKTLRKGVPFLMDLPWWFLGLRYLFGHNLKDVEDRELLVALRASLVPPLSSRVGRAAGNLGETYEREHYESRRDFERYWDLKPEESVGK